MASPLRGHREVADGGVVHAAALLHDRDRLADPSLRLEVAQQDHAVGEIADVDRRVHRADQAVLREHEHRGHAVLPEVAEQLVQMQQEEPLLRHRVEIAVEAVDDQDAHLVVLDRLAHERARTRPAAAAPDRPAGPVIMPSST